MGKFCVAKIKVIAIEDGLSDEGEQEFDGPTYYAVVPEVIWVRPHLREAEEYMKSAHGIIMEVLMR